MIPLLGTARPRPALRQLHFPRKRSVRASRCRRRRPVQADTLCANLDCTACADLTAEVESNPAHTWQQRPAWDHVTAQRSIDVIVPDNSRPQQVKAEEGRISG